MDEKRSDEKREDREQPMDPGPETVDPAPWLGQVGEGATLDAGETIAHGVGDVTTESESEKDESEKD
jgi:hypothetical protein